VKLYRRYINESYLEASRMVVERPLLLGFLAWLCAAFVVPCWLLFQLSIALAFLPLFLLRKTRHGIQRLRGKELS